MKKITTRLLSLVLLGAFIPSFVLAETWDLGIGNITVNATETSQTVSQENGETKDDNNPVITSSGTTGNTVTITAEANATANVTLEDVNINTGGAAITTSGDGNVNIELDGTNEVQSGTNHAGVEKTNDGTLTITDTNQDNGSLTANGGQRGAGIGGGNGGTGTNITISGGEVTANGGEYAAGIGGGENGNGSHITIEGGTVEATGGKCGAGIGGGNNDNNKKNIGKGEDITIKNGTVTATGGEYAAGIGGGFAGAGSDITVSGGNVTATGGKDGGAGIGSGYEGGSDGATNIKIDKIDGGEVTAIGGNNGAGIGGGYNSSANNIEVSKGTVKATGGTNGAGIGGGYQGFVEHITVSGGKVEAQGGVNGAGIGGGYLGSGNEINIKGGKVTATGGDNAAGIGGGNRDFSPEGDRGNGSNITVSGGEVTATGGAQGAGIGGGNGGNGSDITVSGGEVTAKGGTLGAGIGGGGEGRDDNSITINGGKVTAQGGGCGAGIGGGFKGTGSVAISGDAQVKAQGGADWASYKKGAAIGNGGTPSQEGSELTFEPSNLTVDGFIQTFYPGDNIDKDNPKSGTIGTTGDHSWDEGTVTTQPTCTTPGVKTFTCKNPAHGTKTEPIPALNHDFKTYIYDNNATCEADGTETAKCERCTVTDTRTAQGTKLPGDTAETAAENQAAPYWVSGPDGQSLPYQAQIKDGVLAVTVQADTASLRGTTESLGQLEAQGITEIRFITNGAESAFTLSALRTSGTGSFTLTHEGKAVTFTLAEKDISGILK